MLVMIDSHTFDVLKPVSVNFDFAIVLFAQVEKSLLFAHRVSAEKDFFRFELLNNLGDQFQSI
jgi:hypothetical protein